MRLTESEIRILELFVNDIYLELSISSIAKKLQKHYRVIRVNVLRLIRKNLLKSKELAGAKIISLNLNEITLPMYMPYIEEPVAYHRIFAFIPQIEDIIKAASEISLFFCLGIFGSYASNSQKKGSDIDIFLLCPEMHIKNYQTLMNQFPAVQDLIHWNVFGIDEFGKGLKTKGILVYKEIVKNKMIIMGAELFYNIMAEAGKIEQG